MKTKFLFTLITVCLSASLSFSQIETKALKTDTLYHLLKLDKNKTLFITNLYQSGKVIKSDTVNLTEKTLQQNKGLVKNNETVITLANNKTGGLKYNGLQKAIPSTSVDLIQLRKGDSGTLQLNKPDGK